jgi:hypothetical protein
MAQDRPDFLVYKDAAGWHSKRRDRVIVVELGSSATDGGRCFAKLSAVRSSPLAGVTSWTPPRASQPAQTSS